MQQCADECHKISHHRPILQWLDLHRPEGDGSGAQARRDLDQYWKIFEPTVPLSRHIFKSPTHFYKTGIVFLAYLNGHQSHFILVGGQESARSLLHLAELFRLAYKARVLHDPDLAASRMSKLLAVQGLA